MAGTDTQGAAPGSAAPPPPPNANGVDTGGRSYTVTDSRSAGDAIAGLLFGADDDAGAQPDGRADGAQGSVGETPPADTGAGETPPTGDEDDQGSGEQQPGAAAIEPPASWPAEDKAAFSQLPPAMQATIAKRESEREAVLTRRSQEAAEHRKVAETERATAAARHTDYIQSLEKMLVLAAPEAQALQNVDWQAVQRDNPTEFTRLQALQIGLQQRFGTIGQAYQQALQQQQAAQLEQLGKHVETQRQLLNAAWPDFADPVKAPPLRQDLGKYLADSGFSNDEIGQAYDHRLVVLGTKAMLYDKQRAAAVAADGKRDNPPAPVQRPGTSQGTDRGEGQRLKGAVGRLGRTNNVRDAGSLIAEILS